MAEGFFRAGFFSRCREVKGAFRNEKRSGRCFSGVEGRRISNQRSLAGLLCLMAFFAGYCVLDAHGGVFGILDTVCVLVDGVGISPDPNFDFNGFDVYVALFGVLGMTLGEAINCRYAKFRVQLLRTIGAFVAAVPIAFLFIILNGRL